MNSSSQVFIGREGKHPYTCMEVRGRTGKRHKDMNLERQPSSKGKVGLASAVDDCTAVDSVASLKLVPISLMWI